MHSYSYLYTVHYVGTARGDHNNHVIIQRTLIYSYSTLNYTYCYKCVQVRLFYIYFSFLHLPPPLSIGVEGCTQCCHGQSGPQSDAKVLCGAAVNDAADVEVE